MIQLPNEIAPCGICCGACPAFNKTCYGCSSMNENQKRKSKWNCKVRICCYEVKGNICAECSDFPCETHRKKLIDTHQGDSRFAYRHEVPANHQRMKDLGIQAYLEFQKRRWTCPHCDGKVRFYKYRCDTCGREVEIQAL